MQRVSKINDIPQSDFRYINGLRKCCRFDGVDDYLWDGVVRPTADIVKVFGTRDVWTYKRALKYIIKISDGL